MNKYPKGQPKLLCMLLFHVSMKKIRSKTAEKRWQYLLPIISIWGFFRHSRAYNSAVDGLIWANFEGDEKKTQRTNGQVNVHLISGPRTSK